MKYTTVVLYPQGNKIDYVHHNQVDDVEHMLELLGIDTNNIVYQVYNASEIHIVQRYVSDGPIPF